MRHARTLSRAAIVAAVIIAQATLATTQVYGSGGPPAHSTAFVNPAAPNGGALVFEAGAGQANWLTMTVANNGWIVFDDVYPITPGLDCELVSAGDPTKVQCLPAASNADVYLDDGNDALFVSEVSTHQVANLYLHGGAGNDLMMFTPVLADGTNDGLLMFMYGEAGDDTLVDEAQEPFNAEYLYGGDGNDTLFVNSDYYALMEGDAGADTFSGFGTVSYCGHPMPISVTLDNVANDGSPGEGDNVEPSVPNVWLPDGSPYCAP